MKKYSLLTILLFFSLNASSKDYLGFDLCGKIDLNTITTIAKKKITDIKIESNVDGVNNHIAYDLSNFQVDAPRNIQLRTFNGYLYEIKIFILEGGARKDAILDMVAAKYGDTSVKSVNQPPYDLLVSTYETKKIDPELELSWKFARSKFPTDAENYKKNLSYLCKPLNTKLSEQIKLIEKNKKIDQANSASKNKL